MFKAEVKESSRQLTAKERVAFKDTANCIKLDEATANGQVLAITVDAYVVLHITNDKSENPEYENYIIIDTDGNKYVTGSTSFWNSFMDIYEEMKNENEAWELEIYKLDSKNYKGKQFLTCSIR